MLVETVGTRVLTPEEVGSLEREVSDAVGSPVNMDIWYRADAVITDKEIVPFKKFNEQNATDLDKMLKSNGDKK